MISGVLQFYSSLGNAHKSLSNFSHLHLYYFEAKYGNKDSKNIYKRNFSIQLIVFLLFFFSPLFLCLTGFSKRSCSHVVQSLGLRFVWCHLKFSGLFFSFLDSSHLHDYYSCWLRVKGIRLMETYDLRSSPKSCAVSSDTFLSIRSLYGK